MIQYSLVVLFVCLFSCVFTYHYDSFPRLVYVESSATVVSITKVRTETFVHNPFQGSYTCS